MLKELAVVHPALPAIAGLAALIAVAVIADLLIKHIVLRALRGVARRTRSSWDDALIDNRVLGRLAQVVPALIVISGIGLVPDVPEEMDRLIRNVATGYLVLMVTLTVTAALSAANQIYETYPVSRERPLKGVVALHTVKVQNWDKTITTIPTYKLIAESFKNWRGMSMSGGRRIKRAVYIDTGSIRFLSHDETERFRRFALLKDYIAAKEKELADYNANLKYAVETDVNQRRLTNIGTFRAYVQNYLHNHPQLHHQGMTLLVRQLPPGPEGLPIEIYCFTTTTDWIDYEAVQADIFDHLLAIVPEFGLRLYQRPAGADLVSLIRNQQEVS